MRLQVLLVLAALPALGVSLFLMQHAQAGRGPMVLQAATFCLSAIICLLVCRFKPAAPSSTPSYWVVGAALVAVLIPFLLPSIEGPRRWINLGGFRLYSAALVLPAMLALLLEAVQSTKTKVPLPMIAVIGIAIALAFQPDASQATAFALAAALLLHRAPIALVLAFSLGYAWSQADPLKPVLYVEGVLELATSIGPVALIAALVAMALPPAVLLWYARTYSSVTLFSLALYYLAIDLLAYFQLTPMPLLGYGASPILGYFIMIALISPPSKT